MSLEGSWNAIDLSNVTWALAVLMPASRDMWRREQRLRDEEAVLTEAATAGRRRQRRRQPASAPPREAAAARSGVDARGAAEAPEGLALGTLDGIGLGAGVGLGVQDLVHLEEPQPPVDSSPSHSDDSTGGQQQQDLVDLHWRELHIRRRWEKQRIGGWRREAQVALEEAYLRAEDAGAAGGSAGGSAGALQPSAGGVDSGPSSASDAPPPRSALPQTPGADGAHQDGPTAFEPASTLSPRQHPHPHPHQHQQQPTWLLGLVDAVVERHLGLLPTRSLVVVANGLSKLDLELSPRQV